MLMLLVQEYEENRIYSLLVTQVCERTCAFFGPYWSNGRFNSVHLVQHLSLLTTVCYKQSTVVAQSVEDVGMDYYIGDFPTDIGLC